jgi:adenine-specific DNA-methyltransferase
MDRTTGRQSGGWTNKLIWGDNKLVLSSLKNGPLRREIEKAGGLKLVYIDPPFDVGADFSFEIEVGGESLEKEPSVIETIAYNDTWGSGRASYIAMLYERLVLLHSLLADDGQIYVHCDYRVNSYVRFADATARTEGTVYKAMFVREEEWDKRPLHDFGQAISAFDE